MHGRVLHECCFAEVASYLTQLTTLCVAMLAEQRNIVMATKFTKVSATLVSSEVCQQQRAAWFAGASLLRTRRSLLVCWFVAHMS